MSLPEFEKFASMLVRARVEQQSWGTLFEEIRRGDIAKCRPEHINARTYLSESGLIPLLSVWDFHSSPLLDQASALLGVKSWQLTEFIDSVRESCLISESDLVIYEETPSPLSKGVGVEPASQAIPLVNESESYASRPSSRHRNSLPSASTGNRGSNSQLTGLWFLVGLLVGLILVLLSRGTTGVFQNANSKVSDVPSVPSTPDVQPEVLSKRAIPDLPPPEVSQPRPVQRPAPTPAPQPSIWQACQQDVEVEVASPQAGETWWPVVGPPESLKDAKQHCRSDAFVSSRTGKVQIASFRERSMAVRFAEELSSDNSHPWSFEVGPPRVLGGE